MDTRRTLKTFTWPSAILSIMVTAYPATERRETSPAEVTVGHAIYPKVRESPQFAGNSNGSGAMEWLWTISSRGQSPEPAATLV
jgi:hypothetical protein